MSNSNVTESEKNEIMNFAMDYGCIYSQLEDEFSFVKNNYNSVIEWIDELIEFESYNDFMEE